MSGIKIWFMKVVRHALMGEMYRMRLRIEQLSAQVRASKELSEKTFELLLQMSQSHEPRAPEQDLNQAPLQQSRASWMRMKKHFEERDVRTLVESSRAQEKDFIGARPSSSSEQQASAIEEYWTNKQQSLDLG